MGGAATALDTETAWPEDAAEVGRIVDAWGVKGWLKVQPFATDPQALFSSRRWFVRPARDQSPGRAGKLGAAAIGCLKIIAAKEHGDSVVAQAQGIADRAEADLRQVALEPAVEPQAIVIGIYSELANLI